MLYEVITLVVAVGDQELGVRGNQRLVFALDFVLVEIEVDAALRELALRIGQDARQAAGVQAVGDDRGDVSLLAAAAATDPDFFAIQNRFVFGEVA